MDFIPGKLKLSGYIQNLKCSSCKYASHDFTVSADTNMVFDDLVAFVTDEANEIAITNLTDHEFNNWSKITYSDIASRVNIQLGRKDLFHIDKKNFENIEPGKEIYRSICPKCENYMIAENKISLAEYEGKGGRINYFETKHKP
jgi:hypothetical protein